MKTSDTFKVTTSGEREIVMVRDFDALTQPDLVKRWLLGPPGWIMPVCEIDLKVGGAWRPPPPPAHQTKETAFIFCMGNHGWALSVPQPLLAIRARVNRFYDGK